MTHRYDIYPVRDVENIIIDGIPFKGVEINVTVEYALPDTCHQPYSQGANINNVSRIVDINLWAIERNYGLCEFIVTYYNCTVPVIFPSIGSWIVRAVDLNITTIVL
ncbi:MAG: hypothetical protein ACFE9Q_01230 [Candidatus Hodarchaeota archaeon]